MSKQPEKFVPQPKSEMTPADKVRSIVEMIKKYNNMDFRCTVNPKAKTSKKGIYNDTNRICDDYLKLQQAYDDATSAGIKAKIKRVMNKGSNWVKLATATLDAANRNEGITSGKRAWAKRDLNKMLQEV